MTLPRRWTLRPDLIVEVIEGECLILDMAKNTHFGLNRLGLKIWELIAQGQDEHGILAHLVATYEEVDARQLAADVEAFIHQIEAAGLIQRS